MLYTIVFQGDPDVPNQKLTELMNFEDAHNLATRLQADCLIDNKLSIKEIYARNEFFIVTPEFKEVSNE